jgi:signal transduction histidine kinase/CheY-like chemotaxis protein
MRLSLWYKRLVFLLLMLLPTVGIGYLRLVTKPEEQFRFGGTHQILVLTAIAVSGALGYAAYRSYRTELDRSLRYFALGYFGFSLIYSFHGFFTPLAHGHMLLFVVYGPVTRLVMCVCVYAGMLQLLRRKPADEHPAGLSWWFMYAAFFASLALAAGFAAHLGLLNAVGVKLIEGLSLALSLLGVIQLVMLRKRSFLLRHHLLAQCFFAQTSLAFILSSPWNGLWWFAHAVSAAGFMVLGYAIVRSFEQTHSIGSVYEETLLYPVLHSILQTTHEGIVLTDLQGRISFTNQRVGHYFPEAFKRGMPIGISLKKLKLQSAVIRHPMLQAEDLLHGGLSEIDVNVEHPGGNGGSLFYELYAAPVADKQHGDKLGYLFVFRNRTEEERLNQMKNDFIGVVSHELRTPMASILGFTEIMLIRDVPAEKRAKYLQTIHNEANRLSNLINDFLDIQRIESGRQQYQLHPVELNELIIAVMEQWQGKEAHRLRFEASEEPVFAIADAERMIQVLHNLVSNAVKYSPDAGFVELTLRREADGGAVIGVQDYGLGIPEESLPHLFKKFYRVESTAHRKIRGTGLGLTICKEIVEAHKGSIRVQSVPGEGSVFSVCLPEYRLPALKGTLAVLEDEEGQARQLRELLGNRYGEVIRFTNAEEALFVMERTSEWPWLWIMDLPLEGRLDGWSFIRRLRRQTYYRDNPFVISTVNSRPTGRNKLENDLFLHEPYKVAELLEPIASLRGSPGHSHLLLPFYDEQTLLQLLHKQGMEIDGISRSGTYSRITLRGEGQPE